MHGGGGGVRAAGHGALNLPLIAGGVWIVGESVEPSLNHRPVLQCAESVFCCVLFKFFECISPTCLNL